MTIRDGPDDVTPNDELRVEIEKSVTESSHLRNFVVDASTHDVRGDVRILLQVVSLGLCDWFRKSLVVLLTCNCIRPD